MTSKARQYNVGRKFPPVGGWSFWPNGKPKRGIRDKFVRRLERRRAITQSSRIGKALARARAAINEAQSLATNSHEARRYIEAIRKERNT